MLLLASRGLWRATSFLFRKSLHVPHVHRSHYSWEDYLTTNFHQCLILGKASEYNRITKTLHPMTPIIFSKDTIIALH